MAIETLKTRCYANIETEYTDIIRQLPFKVAMQESDKILSLNIKHSIYASVRGGYNIKTIKYDNKSLDHHCYYDSKTWD